LRNADIDKLLAFIEILHDQVTKEFYRPYVLIEHGFCGAQNLYCDEEETLLGIALGYLGPPIPTDQTNKTAVLIDYLCWQKYPKTAGEICDGIAANRFYRAQLRGEPPRETAIKMLICRANRRSAPALAASQAGIKSRELISSVGEHSGKYKIDAIVKVVHRKLSMPNPARRRK
jgi:hypothetical protein